MTFKDTEEDLIANKKPIIDSIEKPFAAGNKTPGIKVSDLKDLLNIRGTPEEILYSSKRIFCEDNYSIEGALHKDGDIVIVFRKEVGPIVSLISSLYLTKNRVLNIKTPGTKYLPDTTNFDVRCDEFLFSNIFTSIIDFMSNRYNLSSEEIKISKHISSTHEQYFNGLVFLINTENLKGEIFILPRLTNVILRTYGWTYAYRFKLVCYNNSKSCQEDSSYQTIPIEFIKEHIKNLTMRRIKISETFENRRFYDPIILYQQQEELNYNVFKYFVETIEKIGTKMVYYGIKFRIEGYGKVEL